jgi:hypothetical protein
MPELAVRCDGCGRRMKPDDYAWVYPVSEVRTNGAVVTRVERDAIYCESCHGEGGDDDESGTDGGTSAPRP